MVNEHDDDDDYDGDDYDDNLTSCFCNNVLVLPS
jgi:hypothetical protein